MKLSSPRTLRLLCVSIITLTLTAWPTLSQAQTGTTFPLVDTGQDKCYADSGNMDSPCPTGGQDFYGQDAQFSGNAFSYTDNGDGTVTDNVTGLVWQKSPDASGDGSITADDKLSYTEATIYCDDLVLGGQSDWRLPDIKQLYSLIDFRGEDISGYSDAGPTPTATPFIDAGYFDFAYGDTGAGESVGMVSS